MSQALSRPLPVVIQVLGLRRNIVVLSLAIFCVGLGEELWARFLPKYLEALGASVLAIGAFGTLQDLLEGLYPYPGGVLADRWGRKRALVTFPRRRWRTGEGVRRSSWRASCATPSSPSSWPRPKGPWDWSRHSCARDYGNWGNRHARR
jgi:hypothetical protein